jgi:hypothetical protein
MTCVEAPVDHEYELYPFPAFSEVLLPVQIAEAPVIVGVRLLFIVTVLVPVPVQPFASVTVTEYEPPVEMVIDWDVAPVDHKYDKYDPASRTTVVPEQNEDGPEMVGDGLAYCVTILLAVPLHPFASVTVTV